MSADFWASASVVTDSPRESRVAAIFSWLTRAQTARTSSTDMPATKRLDILRPREERSEKERRDLFCERAIKNERSKRNTPSTPERHTNYCFMRTTGLHRGKHSSNEC